MTERVLARYAGDMSTPPTDEDRRRWHDDGPRDPKNRPVEAPPKKPEAAKKPMMPAPTPAAPPPKAVEPPKVEPPPTGQASLPLKP